MDYSKIEEKMSKTISVYKENLAEIRAGRANPAVLNKIKIDYYGTPTPINQIAGISVPEARLIVIQPWDLNLLKEIDKEAETILADARQKALKNQNRIVNEAKEEAARIVKHAQEEALLEKKHAMNDMKQEMITVASLMAQKVVAASIDTSIQDSLVDETLKEMGESTWLS